MIFFEYTSTDSDLSDVMRLAPKGIVAMLLFVNAQEEHELNQANAFMKIA